MINSSNNINYRQLLKAIYLKLYMCGFKNISLKDEDIREYIVKLEEIFDKYNIDSNNLFVMTPVLETYDSYASNLIDIFISEGIGCMNMKYDTILLDCNNYYIAKMLKKMEPYNEIVNECCLVISNDKDLILEKTL